MSMFWSLLGGLNLVGGRLMDAVSPRVCELCSTVIGGPEPIVRWGPRRDVCTECEEHLEILDAPFCSRCGESFDGDMGEEEFECVNCSGRRLGFEFAIAGYLAEGGVRDLVHFYKYSRLLRLRQTLASFLVDVLERDPRLVEILSRQGDDVVMVPVPLSRKRRNERGFNQATQLAKLAARAVGVEVVDCLMRSRDTQHQSRLDRADRLKNLRGAFSVRGRIGLLRRPVEGKTVILIDDVFTTGTTSSECASVLKKEGGASRVVVATVARG